MLDLLADLGLGEAEHITFLTHLYLNVGQEKWFPMLQNWFTLDDGVLLLLVQTMGQK